VVVFGSDDETDILEALLESNRQRVKSNDQLAREYVARKEIEAVPAAARRRAGVRMPNLGANLPQGSGKASLRAASAMGKKERTMEKAAEVVRVIDGLGLGGEDAQAAGPSRRAGHGGRRLMATESGHRVTDAASPTSRSGESRNAVEEVFARQAEASQRVFEARKRARICGRCGVALPADPETPLVRGSVGRFLVPDYHFQGPRWIVRDAPLCADCQPEGGLPEKPWTGQCTGCGRRLVGFGWVGGYYTTWCSRSCRQAYYDSHRARRRVAAHKRAAKRCAVCDRHFHPSRLDAVTCSPACRQKAYRQRRRREETG
jgi:hypothetical protein